MMKLFEKIKIWFGIAESPAQNQAQSNPAQDYQQLLVDLAMKEGEAMQSIRNIYALRVKYKIAGLPVLMSGNLCGADILPYHRNGLTCTVKINHGKYGRYMIMPNRTTVFVLVDSGGQRYWEVMVKKFFTTTTDTWDYCGAKTCNDVFEFNDELRLYHELAFLVKDNRPGIVDFGNYRIDTDHKAKTEALYRQRARQMASEVGSAWEKHVKTEAQ